MLLVIVLMVGTNGYAQTINAQLKQLEQIKSSYGEMDERYLNGLNEIASKAITENNWEIAIRLRHNHIELIKQKYGESSIQYAEGLVRNAACLLLSETDDGVAISSLAFQQLERSIKLFEHNNVGYNTLYLLALDEVANYYANNNNYDMAFLYLNKNIELYRDKCRNTKDTSIAVSYFVALLKHTIWSGSVGDCQKRIDYSQEYIFNLRLLANDYFRLNHFSEAISTQKNYVRRIRDLGKKKKISEMDDSLYFQSLSDLALICRIAVQQNDSV